MAGLREKTDRYRTRTSSEDSVDKLQGKLSLTLMRVTHHTVHASQIFQDFKFILIITLIVLYVNFICQFFKYNFQK